MNLEELVSIIIPFRNQITLLQNCLDTMQTALGEDIQTVELVLVDNNSDKAELVTLKIPEGYRYQIVHAPIDFNFQTLINRGAAAATGRYLLLLNNDIVFTQNSAGFLARMRQQAEADQVGAVGALLLYPDGTIQHAGAVVGMNYYADHLYRGWTPAEANTFPFTAYNRDRYVSAVTAACLMVERTKFEQINGLDERFTVCGGDVDFCLRLVAQGYKNIYLGSVELIHLESKTRDPAKIPASDYLESQRSYGAFLQQFQGRDPYYPEPLPLIHQPPTVASAARRSPPQLLQRAKRKVKSKLKAMVHAVKHSPIELTIANTLLNLRHQVLPPPEVKPPIASIDSLRVPHMTPVRWHPESVVQPPRRLNILLPHLIESGIYGGILTAALIGLKFKAKYSDCEVRFLLTDGAGTQEGLRSKLRSYIGPEIDRLDVSLVPLYDRCASSVNVHSQDYFLATAWWTCYSAEVLAKERPFFYLIQDFEPNFYPWNEEYAAALASYRMNFVPLFNTSILKDFFVSERILPASQVEMGSAFEPAIDRALFHQRLEASAPKEQRILFFYGRPGVARNLFSTGLLGITEAIKSGILPLDRWKIISAGEAHPPLRVNEDLVIESIGKLSLEDYAQFLQTVDIGVSLMLSPHPSYPPLEMAASGALCVTNCYGSKDLSQYHSNIISCEPSIVGVMEGIRTAVHRLQAGSSPDSVDRLVYDWDQSLSSTLERIYQLMQAD
jgi:GT2 family glycosyltransferase